MLNNLALRFIHHIQPNLLWHIYAKKCKKLLNESLLILSFDCDTEEDISVALDVHNKLQDIGITPVYAVPGELLKKGAKIYRKIHEMGAEFINHGGRSHTYFDIQKDRYASCFFYDQQSFDILEKDIYEGHEIIKQVLGITANGWRTPHFGTFQNKEHLNFLHSILERLNYKFSTSTIPQIAYKQGAVYKNKTITEIPVTGIFAEPLNIMDTWCYFAAPDRTKNANDYIKTASQLSNFAANNPILINIYGDPSHIYNKLEFFEAMKKLVQVSKNVNYTEFLVNVHETVST